MIEVPTDQWSPLPADYPTLTTEGRKLARVKAASMGGSLGWSFFCDYYLTPDEEQDFDPGFYQRPILPPSPLHNFMVEQIYENILLAFQAPRGIAKSTTLDSVFLRHLLIYPGERCVIFKSIDPFVTQTFDSLRMQLVENERIIADFGQQKPGRGSNRAWNNHELKLQNRAHGFGRPIDGRKRGLRPRLAILDDVEDDKDQKKTARAEERSEELRAACQRAIIPMLDSGCRLALVGTFVGMKAFLTRVIKSEEDPAFRSKANGGHWAKYDFAALNADGTSLWKEKFTPEFIQMKRDVMTEAAFQTEYMGNPKSEAAVLFHLDPQKNFYTVAEGPNPLDDPLQCKSLVTYETTCNQQPLKVEKPFNLWVADLFKGVTVDYAPSETAGSDFNAVVVWGLDSALNDLVVLESWQDRVPLPLLRKKVWDLAMKWRANVVGVEAVALQIEVYNQIREYGDRLREQGVFAPGCIPVKYPPHLSKEARISGLDWRVSRGKFKFPSYYRVSQPLTILLDQIRGFTPDGKGLMYDDQIDALAQVNFVVPNAKEAPPEEIIPEDDISRLKRGEVYLEGTNIPRFTPALMDRMKPGDMEQILEMCSGVTGLEDIWTPLDNFMGAPL